MPYDAVLMTPRSITVNSTPTDVLPANNRKGLVVINATEEVISITFGNHTPVLFPPFFAGYVWTA